MRQPTKEELAELKRLLEMAFLMPSPRTNIRYGR